jgi:hypothetical protein
MKKLTIPIIAVGLVLLGCDAPTTAPTALRATGVRANSNGNGVLHRVSVGSHDFSDPGVDANFSLIALQMGDGSVTGQWSDQFGHGNGGLHVDVNCLEVSGNQAWISGVATSASSADFLVGRPVITRVVDNGTSANDPPDEISFSTFGDVGGTFNCHTRPNLQLFPLSGGEVKVD